MIPHFYGLMLKWMSIFTYQMVFTGLLHMSERPPPPPTLKVVCGCVLLCHYTRKLSVVEVIYTCKDISNTVLNVRGNICSQKMFDRRIVKLMAEHEQRGQCTWNDPHCAVTHAVRKHCTKTEKTISFCALGFFLYPTGDSKRKILSNISFIAFDLHINYRIQSDNNKLTYNNLNCSHSDTTKILW